MFDIEVLIGADELQDESRMKQHRASLDAGARAHQSRSKFLREEINPYVIRVRKPGESAPRELPQTAETKKYRVLRRFYD